MPKLAGFLVFKIMAITYTKKALTSTEQVEQLKQRGLIINNDHEAINFLSHVNYYRLSAYMYPLLSNKPLHIFKSNIDFNLILDLYYFDHELRVLVFDTIEKIEISVRTKIIYSLSHKYNPFWIEDHNLFVNPQKHTTHVIKLKEELNRSSEEFLTHYFSKYAESIPPSWITLETTSFGLLSIIYKNLFPEDKKIISSVYHLQSPVFTSWIHTLVYIRNICAHHSRLWNREIRVPPVIPQKINGWLAYPANQKRIYFIFAIISFFLNEINSNKDFLNKLNALLNKYPMVDLAPMGFTKLWRSEKLFN